jgi:outer membrane murein-binding lipoprotein Lpp
VGEPFCCTGSNTYIEFRRKLAEARRPALECWGQGAAMSHRYLFIAVVLAPVLLAGCASTSNYVRTDGGAINTAQEQATMAQCKAEGATAEANNPNQYGRLERTVTDACMARSGYIRGQ